MFSTRSVACCSRVEQLWEGGTTRLVACLRRGSPCESPYHGIAEKDPLSHRGGGGFL